MSLDTFHWSSAREKGLEDLLYYHYGAVPETCLPPSAHTPRLAVVNTQLRGIQEEEERTTAPNTSPITLPHPRPLPSENKEIQR